MSKTRFSFFALLVSSVLVVTVNAEDKQVESRQQMPESLVDKDSNSPPLPIKKGKFMFSVTLHKREEIDSLLTRAESLSKTMRTKGNKSAIALILHGPEIKLFTRKNYKKNRDIIEKAERLDEENVIQVKVCKTKMKELGIKDEDLPSFMEIIPYAPDEEKKLLDQGYVYL
ncbi:MAG: DsrE family protein [Acidiferrobacterales bacterium]|nr:DsrE family protein [Acidiferrobacterales bacterium]